MLQSIAIEAVGCVYRVTMNGFIDGSILIDPRGYNIKQLK